MNGNDERGIVPVSDTSHSAVKIDKLCIKLGVMKAKDDGPKCRHFSIRGYVAGMREEGRSNLLPFTEELPPMEIPNFKYWRCQKCLHKNGTENASNGTTISVCDQCVLPPARSNLPQKRNGITVLPFGEGTSGLKPVDSITDDDEIVLAALRADESQTSQDISAKVKIFEALANAGEKESDGLNKHENPKKMSIVKETISESDEFGQQNDNNQNGLPRRKARKVRLLKELLDGKTKIQQQKKENSSPSLAPDSLIKRKMLCDHHDHDHNSYYDHKRMKALKGDAIAKTSLLEHSRNPEAREFGENVKNFEWNKHGTQRGSILGKVNSDAVTAWRSIFSDVGRSDNRVPPTYGVYKSRETEPCSKKVTSDTIKSNFFVEDSRRMKDNNRSNAELALDLSLNYAAQSNVRSQPSILNQPPSQDYNRNSSFFLGGASTFPHRIPSDPKSNERSVHEKRLYTQLPYGSCSGHQRLDFSDPYKRNIGVKGYSEFKRPSNLQQDNMLSIGRPDEREVIELMARNQYERNLCEANSGILSGFHKLNMNEGMKSPHPEYLPLRNPVGSFFHQDQVSSFMTNQKKPLNGVWISDSRPQRHYDSHYHYASHENSKIPQTGQTHLYNPPYMQAREPFNKYNNVGNQNEGASMHSGHTFAKYSDKDKGKNMMNLDLNLVAPNAVEEHNNLEQLDSNSNRMSSFDSSYSNEAIPAMQLLSLMDAGKSSQPFSLTGHPFITKPKQKPVSVCYSHCSSTVTEKTNLMVNPIRNSFFSVFQTGQNGRLISSHGQQVYRKPQEPKSRGTSLASVSYIPEDSRAFPHPWHASEGQPKVVNRAFGPRFDSSRTEICTINQNPADFSTPGPENEYMINAEDLIYNRGCSYKGTLTSENNFGPKAQRKVMQPTS